MTWQSDTVTITARKPRRCYWCGETIESGEEYKTWCHRRNNDFLAIQVHPECLEAWRTLPPDEQEVYRGEFSRGCTCQHGLCRCSKRPKPIDKPDDTEGQVEQ